MFVYMLGKGRACRKAGGIKGVLWGVEGGCMQMPWGGEGACVRIPGRGGGACRLWGGEQQFVYAARRWEGSMCAQAGVEVVWYVGW